MGLKEEGLRAFGAWEPLAHRIRGGYAPEHARTEDVYAWEHSEEFIKGLKDRGFNLFITHFSKGFGIEAEAEEYENTRRVAELCHKHGMYVGGYIRYATFIPETMEHEMPDCIEQFASRTASGAFARYNTQYWRYIPCPSSTEFLEYLDRIIEIGVSDIGLDCLHVDGLKIWPEPRACHCARCTAGFRKWLAQHYPTARARKERLGIASVDHVEPPEFVAAGRLSLPLPIIRDPVAQEWMFFRCGLLAGVWKSIVAAAHRRNRECVVQGNSSFYPSLNAAWASGMEISQLAQAGSDGFFTEEGNAPDLTPDGRLHGYFETFKKLRRLGFQVFTYNREPKYMGYAAMTDPERLKRGMAHQMAFNLDSAGVFHAQVKPGQWPVAVPEYMAFHRDRRALFRNAGQAHDVAVYYSERTRALNCGTPIITSLLARDVMLRGHVPFGFLLAERRKGMAEFRCLVLPEVECMTEAEAADLAAYVRNGGGLLVLGANTGRYDELRRLHRENVLAAQLGIEWSADSSAFTVRVGKGRVAFLPRLAMFEGNPADLIRAPEEISDPHYLFKTPHTEWHLPMNSAEMISLLRWACDGFHFELTVPDSVVVEFARQDEPPRYLVHLVNFDLERDVGPFEILCRGIQAAEVEAATPDGPAPAAELLPRAGSASDVVRVEGFHRYLIVAVCR